jgi:hypothetical protein
VSVTEVETIFSGLAGISTFSVSLPALPSVTTTESTSRGQVPLSSEDDESEASEEPEAAAPVVEAESESSS